MNKGFVYSHSNEKLINHGLGLSKQGVSSIHYNERISNQRLGYPD